MARKPLIVLVSLALTAVSMAGCLVDDHDPDAHQQDTDHGDDAGPTDGNGTEGPSGGNGTPTPTNNTTGAPPTATLEVDIANATAPANVTFRLAGTDPDADTLTWDLDWDGDGAIDESGDTLPTDVTVVFESSGNYTARLLVSDGTHDANDTVAFQIDPAPKVKGLCHRPQALAIGVLYVDDRTNGEPDLDHWIYLESNDIPGLQAGGAEESDEFKDCPNPDTLLF